MVAAQTLDDPYEPRRMKWRRQLESALTKSEAQAKVPAGTLGPGAEIADDGTFEAHVKAREP